MAEIVNERLEDETTSTEQVQQAPEEQEKPKDDIPEKYRDKSVEDLVRMHQEAEQLIGRQGQEAGELRKVVDEYIKTKLEEQKPEPAEEVDWFTDPAKAVSKAIENNPVIKEFQKTTKETRRSSAIAQLKQKHPDMENLLQDSKFLEWVQGSPVRVRLLRQADDQYDVDAADELFSNWKERQKFLNDTVEMDRKAQVRRAATGGKSGNADHSSKKVYRRADIIKLAHEDPKRYESLAAEIRQAYAEGRVK